MAGDLIFAGVVVDDVLILDDGPWENWTDAGRSRKTKTSETPEGRSATFKIQGLVFFSFSFFFDFSFF